MTGDHDSGRIGTDEALRLLASDARRQLLVELLDCDDDVSFHLDEAINAIRESPKDSSTNGEGRTDREPGRLAVELHHRHLPRLAETDVIDWDRDANMISKGPAFDDLRPFIEEYAKDGDGLLDD